jgi:ATP-dependent helicase/nuclease subunit A
LYGELSALLAISEVGLWFSRQWKVQTEVPILLPGGGESRLDRLIWKDKKAIVIDFKTGEQKKDDSKQVLAYIETLRQMNFLDVTGYLLYLRDKQVVEVKAGGKQKVVKKIADKDQISLGF